MISSLARLTVRAWAASLLAACALLPLVESTVWLLQAALLLGVQAGVGAAARRVPLARPLTVAAQVVVTLMMLTLMFAREHAIAGLIPGPDALRVFGQLLEQGGQDVNRYAIPAPLSDGIRLMLVGGVLVIGLLVDVLAVTFRSAAPAGLPLLALYSVAAGLTDNGIEWLWFLLAAAGYLMLLLAEGRDRLSQWGRVFAGPARGRVRATPDAPSPGAGAVRAPDRGGGAGHRPGGAAGAARDERRPAGPERPGRGGRRGRHDLRGEPAGVAAGLAEQRRRPHGVLGAHRDGEHLGPVPADRVPGRLRRHHVEAVEAGDHPGARGFPAPAGLGSDVEFTEVGTSVSVAKWYGQTWLPMPYPPSRVSVQGDWRYEPVGMTLVGDHGQDTRGLTYEVRSLDVRPTAEQLTGAPEPPADLVREYTELPDELPSVIHETAREVTAGAQSDYDRAVMLQDFFTLSGGFQYDTQVDVGSGSQAIARFLKEKRGFCVHYSFAMASMARSLGIPARIAVGFAPGTPQADGTISVAMRDAHAWPELYFEGRGLDAVRADPDPGFDAGLHRAGRPGQRSRGSGPAVAGGALGPGGDAVAEHGLPGGRRRPGVLRERVAAGGPAGGRRRSEVARGAAVGPGRAAGAGAAAVAAAVADADAGGAAGRPRPYGGGRRPVCAGRLGGADGHGLGPRDRAGRVADPARGGRPHRADGRARRRRGGIGAAAGGGGGAGAVRAAPRPAVGLAEDVRRASGALRDSASRGARLRALLAPRSAVRVVWAVSDRWASLRDRLVALRPGWHLPTRQRG